MNYFLSILNIENNLKIFNNYNFIRFNNNLLILNIKK